MKVVSDALLRRLRNEIPIADLMRDFLDMYTKHREGFVRFRCPECNNGNTAINPKTNLARCFTCRVNYNPIDLVRVVFKCGFLSAVQILTPMLPATKGNNPAPNTTAIKGRGDMLKG